MTDYSYAAIKERLYARQRCAGANVIVHECDSDIAWLLQECDRLTLLLASEQDARVREVERTIANMEDDPSADDTIRFSRTRTANAPRQTADAEARPSHSGE